MPNNFYCWGDRNIPYRIIDQADNFTIIEIDGEPKQIPNNRIKGWIKSGQKVKVLVSGGNWLPGIVLDCDQLRVRFDKGFEREIYDASWLQAVQPPKVELVGATPDPLLSETCYYCPNPTTLLCDGRTKDGTCDRPLCRDHARHVSNSFYCNRAQPSKGWVDTVDLCVDCAQAQAVPMPELEDYEEDEMSMALQHGLLEPLKDGDRVQVVLAGKPLEYLTGLHGTVDGAETFGLIPVNVDGYGPKVLRREQLDLLEPNGSMGISIDPLGGIAIGSKVQHPRYWLGQTGVVKKLEGAIAWVHYRDGVPLYPCGLDSLHVLE